VFQLKRHSADEVGKAILAATRLSVCRSVSQDRLVSITNGVVRMNVPRGFVLDRSVSVVGCGERDFALARQAMRKWVPFDLGWARVVNPEARIEVGQVVGVEVKSLGLWSLNLSRIVETVDSAERFGFIYSTTSMHVEEGEELFLIEFDSAAGEARYRLEAVSRPRSLAARVGFPVTRVFQHRFARDSQSRMADAVSDGVQALSTPRR
jgi:uncharacterized protein (UPF0548 family)